MFRKWMLTLSLLALVLGAVTSPAMAQGSQEDPQTRLETAWERLTKAYARVENQQAQYDAFVASVQARLDLAAGQGADMQAAQAALAAFVQAVEMAQPLYAQAAALVADHNGFAADGQVQDEAQAAESVRALAEALRALRQTVAPAARDLKQALADLQQETRLERDWARWREVLSRLEKRNANRDDFLARLQARLEKAAAEGADVTEAQAALDDFLAALDAAQPLLAEAGRIAETHAGFTTDGQLTEATQAITTIQSLGDVLRQLRALLAPADAALRQALRDLRPQAGSVGAER